MLQELRIASPHGRSSKGTSTALQRKSGKPIRCCQSAQRRVVPLRALDKHSSNVHAGPAGGIGPLQQWAWPQHLQSAAGLFAEQRPHLCARELVPSSCKLAARDPEPTADANSSARSMFRFAMITCLRRGLGSRSGFAAPGSGSSCSPASILQPRATADCCTHHTFARDRRPSGCSAVNLRHMTHVVRRRKTFHTESTFTLTW